MGHMCLGSSAVGCTRGNFLGGRAPAAALGAEVQAARGGAGGGGAGSVA